ncbi:retrovirus-related pol polyprotein from transposon 17.6 [Plakobranchus ocellatus]|uniref:Retrovirus-related pol polyprotein from transposon 17.6 n=1 Tax=Plakobranchus ocellatus TaxID=259542 RepID=A0AAV4BXJ1_9GAST|nr:retrovirus-related pol polyprotein from transposon 17.6 [Plakobranchus ocellatus]
MPKPDNFNEAGVSFTNYEEWLDSYFQANDVSATKQNTVLLSAFRPKVYGMRRSLTSPDLTSTKTFDELCDVLSKHFCPSPWRS